MPGFNLTFWRRKIVYILSLARIICLFCFKMITNDMMNFRFHIFLKFALLLYVTSCAQPDNESKEKYMFTNELIHESSPYLLQHAHNPVNWYPWGDKALDLAKKEDKMLLISIGYAACHWCHVMEHQSFEDTAVAALMNKYFVCIKVDREERPDVDQVYMNAAYLVNGSGGWPLNALATPDGKPFFAGTYFPKENWMKLLEYFGEMYQTDRKKIEAQAEQLAKGIGDIENIPLNDKEVAFSTKTFDDLFVKFKSKADHKHGGTTGKMKFPMPSIWEFLLQYHYLSGNKEALELSELTLMNMAYGGIYDQVGGGFSRYATDVEWHAPHFEKMLYDNAQLVSLYSHAFQVTGKPLYKRIVKETLQFIARELTSPDGVFYSSLDADSEGEEGKFYVWSKKEIEDVLGNDAPLFNKHFGIKAGGNWEGKNIPDMNMGVTALKDIPALEKENAEKLNALKERLLKERDKRIRPRLDDKILTSWNALMIKGYIEAYKAFGDNDYLEAAEKSMSFLLKNIASPENSLFRSYKNGKATIPAFLDDYAFMISALVDLYQVTFKENYLMKAKGFLEYTQTHFLDKSSGMFFYTDADHSDLIARKMEVSDNVIPSSNSEMARNLLLLGNYFENELYITQSEQIIKNVFADIQNNPAYYSNYAQVMSLQLYPPFEIAIVGTVWKEKLGRMQKEYLPQATFMGGEQEGNLSLLQSKLVDGKTMIYVCQNKTCLAPVENAEAALGQVKVTW
ncbi:thioredoxin domain-containing protein [soil metagenome]